MGQHRIQRQILQSFSFQGRQKNAREDWWLGKDSFQPQTWSISVGGFTGVSSRSLALFQLWIGFWLTL